MIVDLLILCLVIGAAIWGYRLGLTSGGLALIGFGIGAILGSRLAPLTLAGGLEDPFAPVLALPAALIVGALLAAGLERFGFRLRRVIERRGTTDTAGGAILAGCLGLVIAWTLGALAARVDGLRSSVRDSAIIPKLNAVLPPPGPLLNASQPRDDLLPVVAGPRASVGPVDPKVTRDPQVRGAARSVMKVFSRGCGGTAAQGSGWVARDGVVVTAAHVVAGFDDIGVQVGGKGEEHDARVIWFDGERDIAILRSPGVSRTPPLPIEGNPKADTFAAALGFPKGGPYTATAARVGSLTPSLDLEKSGLRTRSAVTMRADVTSGNSGGPVVNRRGQLVTMVYAVRAGGSFAYGVPAPSIARALLRAGEQADTGRCED